MYIAGPLTEGQVLDVGSTSFFTCKVTPNVPECVHFELIRNSSYYSSYYYSKEECVKDTNSGLTWEGKPTSGLRAYDKTYTNYDTNSLVPAAQINASTNALAYQKYLNFTNHCGYNDWRLPTVEELKTLANEIAPGGTVPDPTWFPNTKADVYWTATSNDAAGLTAWEVGFGNDHLGPNTRSSLRYLRLVRDGGPYSITSVTAAGRLVAGEKASFKISGKLPSSDNLNITVSGAGCDGFSYDSRSSDEHRFTCTPNNAGTLSFAVRTAPTGPSLGIHTLAVEAARYSLVQKTTGSTYTKNECVKDNLTGLTWEGKSDSYDDYRYYSRTYTNYDNTQSPQMGEGKYPTQKDIDANTNSIGYVNYVNFLGLCGYSDWRLPSFDELRTLIDKNFSPTINSNWFRETARYYDEPRYLSSTSESGNPYRVHGIDFSDGADGWRLPRRYMYSIRLVR